MRTAFFTVIVVAIMVLPHLLPAQIAQPYSRTEKPWTYWWWMGSAVDEDNIRHQLQAFAEAGFGGVHIIPIYGVKGHESKFISYRSDAWMRMLEFAISEADKAGLGVDMTMGTGWPFGGPQIKVENAAKRYTVENNLFKTSPTGQKVKRAAPGGEGLVMDHFDKPSVQQYLHSFETSLSPVQNKLRGLYNDSYEVYGANWTTNFLQAFKKKRGYDLEEHIKEFLDTTGTQSGILVKIDYHQTISEMLHDSFTDTWTSWSRKHTFVTRNQAHGSPGNLLDLYALADIPETESFGTSGFTIPGLRIDEHYEVNRFGTPDPLAMKFASSAANLTGKKMVSAETGTWLGDHFKVSLSQVKPQLDELFTSGINHVFYHGITYSPREEGFPGWLFYASTNFGPQSHVWKHIVLLNSYVTRAQHILQNSKPDNDILLYFPIHDLWATKPKAEGGIHLLEVHHTKTWLRSSAFGKLAASLQDDGLSFDYVSDSLLLDLKVVNKNILSGDAAYKVIVVPPLRFIPQRTLHTLNELSKQGAVVIFQDHLPERFTGLLPSPSTDVQAIIKDAKQHARVVEQSDLSKELTKLNVKQEGFSRNGLSFIRKHQTGSNDAVYFVSNLKDQFKRGWIALSGSPAGMQRYDPLADTYTPLPSRINSQHHREIFLELSPGQSCFLFTSSEVNKKTESLNPMRTYELTQGWSFEFEAGQPHVQDLLVMETLHSWTTFSDSSSYFYGSGLYTQHFTLPDSLLKYKEVMIDLGDIHEVATVVLNGQNLGTSWSIPYRLKIPVNLLKQDNIIEIHVSNLSANYMRLYDKLHPEWKKFYDINIVDIQYKPYDGSRSTVMPSGLTGQVSILYR